MPFEVKILIILGLIKGNQEPSYRALICGRRFVGCQNRALTLKGKIGCIQPIIEAKFTW